MYIYAICTCSVHVLCVNVHICTCICMVLAILHVEVKKLHTVHVWASHNYFFLSKFYEIQDVCMCIPQTYTFLLQLWLHLPNIITITSTFESSRLSQGENFTLWLIYACNQAIIISGQIVSINIRIDVQYLYSMYFYVWFCVLVTV